MTDLERLKKILIDNSIFLDDAEISKLAQSLERLEESSQIEVDEKIQQLENEIHYLNLEKYKYQSLLNQKFHDKNNQTIAYQFGKLILDFLHNPKQNFIKPNDILSIYAQSLKRKEKKHSLNAIEKKFMERFYPARLQQVTDEVILEKTSNTPEVSNIPEREMQEVKTRKPLKLNLSHKKAKDLKVAVILDEFSFNSFKNEFLPLVITPNNWKTLFATQKPDLFFCESAWSGSDSKNRPWKGQIYASVNFSKENRTALLEILAYCNDNGIPTVFWNKEDPTHYPDRIHDFVKTACLFDFVFTTAEECVEKYRQDYGLKNVYSLPFATNPILFNPIDNINNPRTKKMIFAGSWYANHLERSKIMTKLFDSLIDGGYELEFYNRYYGDTDPNHIIPEQYQSYERPSIANKDIGQVYKSSVFGLNFNTVTNSNTMFARRVFELMSSNTLVLSNYSQGMREMFGDNVIFLDTEPERLNSLTSDTIECIREQNLHNVLANHTYQKRFEKILDKVGLIYNKEIEKITLLVHISDEKQAKSEIAIFQQKFSNNKYRLMLLLSDEILDLNCADLYSKFNHQRISVIAKSYIQKYGKANNSYIETPYFVLTDSLLSLMVDRVEKALLHSCYILNDYISLKMHKEQKYIFESAVLVNQIFAPAHKFYEATCCYNKVIDSSVYYIDAERE